MAKKYRKKPVVVEAIQWTGKNLDDVIKFNVNGQWKKGEDLKIFTLEGVMKANIGDYIIKGVKGEFYPCKPDIFEKTYEEVKTENAASKEEKIYELANYIYFRTHPGSERNYFKFRIPLSRLELRYMKYARFALEWEKIRGAKNETE